MDGRRLKVAQAGPHRLFFAEPVVLSSSTGQLVISIDGREHKWSVLVPTLSAPTDRVDIELAPF